MSQDGSVLVRRTTTKRHDHCSETERPRVYDGVMRGPESQDRLTLTVRDFGPIHRGAVDLRPLTVFVGQSNTGKSYLAILIYALHNLFSAGDDQRGMRKSAMLGISGSPRALPLIPQAMKTKMSGDHTRTFVEWTESAVDNASQIPKHLPESIVEIIRPSLEISEESMTPIESEIMRCFGQPGIQDLIRFGASDGASINIKKTALSNSGISTAFDCNIRLNSERNEIATSVPRDAPLRVFGSDLRRIHRISQSMIEASERASLFSRNSHEGRQQKRRLDRYISWYADALVRSTLPGAIGPLDAHAYYLPADRTGIMHAHRVVVSTLIGSISTAGLRPAINVPSLSGILTDFLQELISLVPSANKLRIPRHDLGKMIEDRVLKGSVVVETSDAYPSFSYRPDGLQRDIPLARSSSMVSELSPVVLYLRHIVRRGDVLIIEEPESHLHPEMQVKFCCEIARLVRSGVRILITTHSELILEQIGNLIRISELPRKAQRDIAESDLVLESDNVGVWLFSHRSQEHGTTVEEAVLDSDSGLFRVGYGTVREALYNQNAITFNRMQEIE